MRYYEFWFDGAPYLFNEGWTVGDDGLLDQTFYAKSEDELTSLDRARDFLLEKFPKTNERYFNLINCVDERTAWHLARVDEISSEEFTIGCGIEA